MHHRLLFLLLLLPVALAGQATVVAEADTAIRNRQPWHATELLAPVLASPATRTPEAVITAARAAAGWRGWSTVRSLLGRENWLDSRFDRLGRRLLAEALLGEQELQQALINARAAMATGDGRRDRPEQGRRFLTLARVQDRLEMLDSATANYRRAAVLLPEIADWLFLRAAGVERDSLERARLYSALVLPAAKPRIPWTEALAFDRLEQYQQSAVRYDQMGANVSSLKVRWKGAASDQARAMVASDLLGLLTPRLDITSTREALDLLAQINPPLDRDKRIEVGRRAVAAGRTQQIVDLFGAALIGGALEPRDQLAYATALGTLNKWTEAAKQFRSITDSAIAGQAAYYHARALLRLGDEPGSIKALESVIQRFPNDTVATGTALYLLGDLAIDAGRPDSARALYVELVRRFPTSSFRSRALIVAAIVAFENGNPVQAAKELAAGIEQNPPSGLELDGYRYWIGRSLLQSGDTLAARATFRALLTRGPESYYAQQAAVRLDTIPWSAPPAVTQTIPRALVPVFARITQLEELGLDVEAKFELDRVAADANGAAALVQTAQAFAAAGYPARGQQMAVRAQAAGAPRDGVLWRLLYPLPYASLLKENAAREGVDPFMAASVIRQESGFDPRAVSRTDARGLMQMMPAVGKEIAQGTALSNWDVAALFIPDVNLSFGMQHFADRMTRYPEIERALAAYNAGASKVDSWSKTLLGGARLPTDSVATPLPDVEMFIERIPFVETRDYVRLIMRNLKVYRMLYGGVP